MTTASTAAAELRAEMARQNVDVAELAERTGKSTWWVTRRRTGQTSMTVADIHLIARALDIPPAQLLGALPT